MPASTAPPDTAPDVRPPGPPGRRPNRLVPALRWSLVVLAVLGIRYGVAELRIPSTADRELAAWQIATAVGLLTAARRPVAAEALLPTFASAGGLTAAVSVRDIAVGRTSTPQESPHLWLVVAFALTVVLWIAADG